LKNVAERKIGGVGGDANLRPRGKRHGPSVDPLERRGEPPKASNSYALTGQSVYAVGLPSQAHGPDRVERMRPRGRAICGFSRRGLPSAAGASLEIAACPPFP
jgi:hypothetical protein